MTTNQLIGAEVSLYTGKLRCYLKYKDIPFEEVVASQSVFCDVIIPRTGVRYIPIFITEDDQAIQDTTEIIDFLEKRYPEASVYPGTPKQNLVSLLLETYGDEWLVIPAMHYRWNKPENREFAIAEFGRTAAPEANREEQLAIGHHNAKPFAGALPRLGVVDELVPAIEKSYLNLLADLDRHFAEHNFLLGDRPCMGDFGLIGPLYAHLYRDPYSGRLMQECAPNVVAWVKRMIEPAPLSSHFPAGDFLANDAVPETLYPILQRMLSEQGPVLKQTMDQVGTWVGENPEVEIPRAIGKVSFTIESVSGSRLTFPYMQWMWQRCHDFYHGLQGEEKATVKTLLSNTTGLEDLLNYPIHCRVRRIENQLRIVR
ncbi:glutathione S-transferase family protein [Microbulbifer celer]|uniref:Glutathione S-transferase family protein n=1 Tax=Microbulbifer celer TaxID=435905 RepID=A0ABW3UDU9_9GAMM|nr:glutathione S-transferase family protein [Microbulbifer celer]UFN56474.1 glutathione S-transferase [Microbulbifer celer]